MQVYLSDIVQWNVKWKRRWKSRKEKFVLKTIVQVPGRHISKIWSIAILYSYNKNIMITGCKERVANFLCSWKLQYDMGEYQNFTACYSSAVLKIIHARRWLICSGAWCAMCRSLGTWCRRESPPSFGQLRNQICTCWCFRFLTEKRFF